MALRQIDGHDVGLGDMFAVGDAALGLAVASILLNLGLYLGLMLLVIPGLIFAGVTMFTLPMVVDGPKPTKGRTSSKKPR